jgi:hypothetical protein
MAQLQDLEVNGAVAEKPTVAPQDEPAAHEESSKWSRLTRALAQKGDVELQGCIPIPHEDRTETNYLNIFTLWFSMSCNPLPYVLTSINAETSIFT